MRLTVSEFDENVTARGWGKIVVVCSILCVGYGVGERKVVSNLFPLYLPDVTLVIRPIVTPETTELVAVNEGINVSTFRIAAVNEGPSWVNLQLFQLVDKV